MERFEMKRKIIVVISARASYSRVRTALMAMYNHAQIDLSIVLMASAAKSKYGDIKTRLESAGMTICAIIDSLSSYGDHYGQVETVSNCLISLADVFRENTPDAVMTIADRYETIATAIAASYMNIPLIHLQGGEVTGNIDEKVRHAITKLADIHLPCTMESAQRLIKMGERPDRVFQLGCPSCDIAQEALEDPRTAEDVARELGLKIGYPLTAGTYIVVMQHSVTDEYQQTEEQFFATLEAVLRLNIPIIWIGNNVDAGADRLRRLLDEYVCGNERVWFINHIPGKEFLIILRDCRCLIGNSSVGIRECSFMGVPVVNIGSRQEGRERGNNVVDADFNADHIIDAYAIATTMTIGRSTLYGDGNAGEKIAELVATVDLNIRKRLTY